jgi:branched-chain amino acid transport system ATP-binding protein
MLFLQLDRIVVNFGGVRALNDVTVGVERGELVGLIGPNGAGKTTLCQVVSGFLRPSGGRVWLEGEDVTGRRPYDVCRLGVARTFQTARPFLGFSVLDNVAAAALFSAPAEGSMARCRTDALGLLERVGLADKAAFPPTALSLGEKKKLELARALATRPRLVLLDEVMAGLAADETDDVMALVREIHAGGAAVIMVEHVVRVVMSLAQRVVVLDHGEKIADGPPAAVAADPLVVTAYLGAKRAGREAP